jgi:Flp pilus assembly pilin Flp
MLMRNTIWSNQTAEKGSAIVDYCILLCFIGLAVVSSVQLVGNGINQALYAAVDGLEGGGTDETTPPPS